MEKNSQAALQARSDGEKLNAYIKSVPYCEYRETIKTIKEACMISKITLSNWRQGKCRIPELYKAKINEIAQKQVF